MKKYNFDFLTWFDFEGLARDIVEEREGIVLEAFTTGIDNGIDFRRIYDKDQTLVVQSKHYKTYNSLCSALKNKELDKVKKLNPSRYILVTSVDMTPTQKDKIVTLFSPYILNPLDIICGNDIEQDLDKNESLLKKNHKLWLTSSSVLNLLLQRKIIGRSNQLETDIKDKIKIYVETDTVDSAIDILSKNSYVIIAGAPGVGKTTLAQILSLYYIKDGYQLAYVTNIDEAEEVLQEKTKQVIYYDDFLGTNLLKSAPFKNEDKRLVNFLKRVQSSKKTKLIMTTREYILRQARNDFEDLNRLNIDLTKVTIELGRYSTFQKAHILYNHLYYSHLDKDFLKNIAEHKNYEKIINHPNYNPRLIESMTSADQLLRTTPDKFIDDFITLLDDPAKVWENVFESHITENARLLVYALLISPAKVTIPELSNTFQELIRASGSESTILSAAFNAALKEIDDTFIKIRFADGVRQVEFANPSVIDFLTNYVNRDSIAQKALVSVAAYLDPLVSRFSLDRKAYTIHVTDQLRDQYISRLVSDFDNFMDVDLNDDKRIVGQLYEITKVFKNYHSKPLKDFMINRISGIDLSVDYDVYDFNTYIELLHKFKLDNPTTMRAIVRTTLLNASDLDDLKKVATLNASYDDILFDVALDNTIDLAQVLTEAVEVLGQNAYEFEIGELEAILDDIADLEQEFDHNVTAEKELIEEVLREKTAQEEMELNDMDRGNVSDEADNVDSLFRTLISSDN
jgi:hypothetical protein